MADKDHGPRHRPSKSHPRKPDRHGARRQGSAASTPIGYFGLPTYGQGYYQGVLGNVTSTGTNPPISGPGPGEMQGPSGHLSPDQFSGFPGGYQTDAGNYTGVQAIQGAEGNGGAGGSADSGAAGGAPS